jgi:hypothetical protein
MTSREQKAEIILNRIRHEIAITEAYANHRQFCYITRIRERYGL